MELEDFVASEKNRTKRWVDDLPEDVKEQILKSNAGASQITRWLINMGYHDATVRKVEPIVEQRRRGRE